MKSRWQDYDILTIPDKMKDFEFTVVNCQNHVKAMWNVRVAAGHGAFRFWWISHHKAIRAYDDRRNLLNGVGNVFLGHKYNKS